jgi:TRAP-type C4-dicarboxylate transport system substrate-binding protein
MAMKEQKMLIVALSLIALVSGMIMPMNVSAQDKVYELKFAWNDIWGPKFRASQVYRPCGEMQRIVEERTNGRVKMKIISKMFPTSQLLESVATGKADASDLAMPWLSGTYPLLNWGVIPGIVNTDPVEALGEELAVYEDPKVMEILDKRLKEVNLKLWFVTQWDPANGIWSKNEIKSIEDIKGMKMSVAGGFYGNLGAKNMGASAVAITSAELAPAMMTGTVDGVLTSLGYGYSIGLAKVSKYYTLTPLNPTWTAYTVINRKTYDSMPPDLQKALMDAGRELQRMVCLSTTAEYVMSLDTVALSGVERKSLPPAEQKMALEKAKVVEEKWLQDTGDKGKELLEAIHAAVNRYRDCK